MGTECDQRNGRGPCLGSRNGIPTPKPITQAGPVPKKTQKEYMLTQIFSSPLLYIGLFAILFGMIAVIVFREWFTPILGAVFGAIIGCLLFCVLCLNHVEVNQMGVAYDSINGSVTPQIAPGWYRTHPLVKVCYLSLLPQSVHIPSDAKVINTKIVRFKPEGLRQFVDLHGFSYSLGSSLNTTLMGYAFSGQKFEFLELVQEGGAESLTPVRAVSAVK